MLDLQRFEGFDWDEDNAGKSWVKHRVTSDECEPVFFNEPLLLLYDQGHSDEERHYVLGRTDAGRKVMVVFTPRGRLIRVISARGMTPAEKRRYHAEA